MKTSLMLVVTAVLLSSIGCTRTMEYTTSTEVYPNNPNVVQRINVSTTFRSQW